tara:strand:+ start:64 stop:237 length:174 start_codon:yes stop_codon:yes gene_type:complete
MTRPIPLKTRIRRSVSQKKKSKGDDTTPRFMLGKDSEMTLESFRALMKKFNKNGKLK